jgi:chaperonin GroES
MPRSLISDVAYKLPDPKEIAPLADYILVEVLDRGYSKTGLIIPGNEKSECLYGRVVRLGQGEYNPESGRIYPIALKEGDIIMSVQYMGEKVQAVGKKYKLIRDHGIWARLILSMKSETDWEIAELFPYRDHILVKMDSEEKTLKGHLFMPSNPQAMYRVAEVVSIGPGARKQKADKPTPVSVKPGDKAICMRYAGCIVRVKGVEYRLVSEEDIEAVIEGGVVDVIAGQDKLAKPVDDYEVIPESHLDELNQKTLVDSGGN